MEEKSQYTVEKYLCDARTFAEYAEGRAITKELAIDYKIELIAKGYAVSSINSMLEELVEEVVEEIPLLDYTEDQVAALSADELVALLVNYEAEEIAAFVKKFFKNGDINLLLI